MRLTRFSHLALGLLVLLVPPSDLGAVEGETSAVSDETDAGTADPAGARVAATVNGHPVTWAEVNRIYEMVGGKAPKEAILQRLIERQAVNDHLDEEGFEVSQEVIDKEIEEFNEALVKSGKSPEELLKSLHVTEEEFREQMSLSIRLTKYLEENVTEDEIIEAMGQVRTSQIQLVIDKDNSEEEVRTRIETLEKELRNAKDLKAAFAEAARRESDHPSGKSSDGDLGFMSRLMMPKPLAEVAFNLEVGQMGPPVRSRFGYHLIYLTERKPFTRKELEKNRDPIRRGYIGLRIRSFPMELAAEADVVRYPEEKKPDDEDASGADGEDAAKDSTKEESDEVKSPGGEEK